ncbi:MAG: FAD-binding protein [Candidatus Solibacter sp.]|nr:FAD-binding protein [Candidatus Solibacter sp.]
MIAPSNPAELAEALRDSAAAGRSIALAGNSTKRRMAGPVEPADVALTTMSLRGVLQYEPRDLTISVYAGLSWCEFTHMLAENRQMVPLDPPFAEGATVGGVISTNCSGPRRRLYGTARDLVIGMQFATLEGKLVKSGGMVVKNVAGLDMAKLMIGSFGTLAAITVVNFKLQPVPEVERSFLLPFDSLAAAIAARDVILKGQLQPAAIDLLNPAAARTLGNSNWLLALRAGGNATAVQRYEREFANFTDALAFEDERQQTLWRHVENYTPRFLAAHDDGAVVRASCTLKDSEAVMESFPGPAVARAGSGVCHGYFERALAARDWLAGAQRLGCKAVIEFAPEGSRRTLDLWPSPGGDFEIMKRVKHLFDPRNLLNRGRLYRRI